MNGDSLISQIGVFLGTLLGIVLILYLAYVSTKLIGKRYSARPGSGKKLKIVESVAVGKDKSLLIVKAGGKTFLVGNASGSINLISELDSAEFPEEEASAEAGMDFKTAFKTVLEKNFSKRNKSDKEKENDSSQTKQG